MHDYEADAWKHYFPERLRHSQRTQVAAAADLAVDAWLRALLLLGHVAGAVATSGSRHTSKQQQQQRQQETCFSNTAVWCCARAAGRATAGDTLHKVGIAHER